MLAAAAAGKQIFCEKPFALSAEAARRMLDACYKAGLRAVGIGDEPTSLPAWQALVPKPRVNLMRFHGAFAPNSKYRAGDTGQARQGRPACHDCGSGGADTGRASGCDEVGATTLAKMGTSG